MKSGLLEEQPVFLLAEPSLAQNKPLFWKIVYVSFKNSVFYNL